MKPPKEGRVDKRKKQLINLPDEQKAWIMKVVELAEAAGYESNQTEVIRALVGSAMREDPESFVTKLEKLRLNARLEDIERRSLALEEEKVKLQKELEEKAQLARQR